jgi:L,D-peptidoglycan transpeptidase YkuD (ErfK/YbiS/YcfS/YnhG family)
MGNGTRRGQVFVRVISRRRSRGHVTLGNLRFPCALGRSGSSPSKREGDGATPLGPLRVQTAYYRPDRLRRPRSGVPLTRLRPQDGWCDAPGDRNYNRRVRHPYPASAEHLWRHDHLYDVVVVLSHNDCPRIRGRGSAIFLHVASAGLGPTAGCITLSRSDLLRLLPHLRAGLIVRIG